MLEESLIIGSAGIYNIAHYQKGFVERGIISQSKQVINFLCLHLYPIQAPGLGRASRVQYRCRCRGPVREAIWSQQVRRIRIERGMRGPRNRVTSWS